MRWMGRVLGLGVVVAAVALLGAGCGGSVQVEAGAPAPAGRASCASVCPQMAGCPAKGPVCPQTCQAATSLSAEAGCEASLQATLDCLGGQSADVCGATRNACQVQTVALASCFTNYCAHPRFGANSAALCLQAAAGF